MAITRGNAGFRDQRIESGNLAYIRVQPVLIQLVREGEVMDPTLQTIKRKIKSNSISDFELHENGILRFWRKVCVPNNNELKKEILAKVHHSKFAIYPGSTKMYQNLQKQYWWSGMK